ncbi:biotin-dependent carboxyltransferase family protein [Actinomadura sp. DC4]|uniref:5-oxoprolinase subunit C family protein n=1 Tax=Actinomadura sp. DC4 TaxID=3055069 RepID=UPI0025B14E5F|nr:biotin-dependent carboxyltransferase family protein [Actinomadura sp. DC4]MDN3359329.1 biotin-dependent carboxyltransferase family protein [Actinomadura sp. DC4]
MIEVVRSGPLATVQDLGRAGYAHLGVPFSGAADRPSLCLANRLVGNPEDAAGLELTFGGAALRFEAAAWIAVTGAPLHLRPGTMNAPSYVPAGAVVEFGAPSAGVRTYVGVRGGIDVPAVLGSRSTDMLSGLGPPPLSAGDRLRVGRTTGQITVDVAPGIDPEDEPVLRITAGPRDDWFETLAPLGEAAYEVTARSNRVGVRLDGPALARRRQGELPSEGMVTGALQVPPNGLPIIFLADHPTTGGYPVAAVLAGADIARAGQLRPGQRVRFRLSGSRSPAPAVFGLRR